MGYVKQTIKFNIMNSKVKLIIVPVLVFFALMMCTSCSEGNNHPDLKLFHLNGKVKSLKYRVISDKDAISCVGVGMGEEYNPYYVYEFSKEGEWINPINGIERNSEGYIISTGLHRFEWNDKGQLEHHIVDDIYGGPPATYLTFFYSKDNIIDSLENNVDGLIHRYYNYSYKDSEGEQDKYNNWRYVDMKQLYEFDYSQKDAFVIVRQIEYWSEEELNEGKKRGSSKNLTAAFNETIKNRLLIFRFPFDGECYKSLLFYPITETKGHAYLLNFDSKMSSCSRWHSYKFIYTISNDEIFITNGESLAENMHGDYNKHEDTVLKITKDSSNKIELQVMPNGPTSVEYIWKSNIDDFKNKF